MEKMTVSELQTICDNLHHSITEICDRYRDLPYAWTYTKADADELTTLNDDFNRYQRRLSYLLGKRIERQEIQISPTRPIDKRKKDTGVYFITISPPPEANLIEFINATHRFMTLKVVKEGSYVFEQRGETEEEMGKTFHAHLLVTRRSKPSAFNKELHRIFDNFFRELPTEEILNVENVENMEKSKVNRYINGEKYGQRKGKKAGIDKLWRKKLNIKDIYTTTDIV